MNLSTDWNKSSLNSRTLEQEADKLRSGGTLRQAALDKLESKQKANNKLVVNVNTDTVVDSKDYGTILDEFVGAVDNGVLKKKQAENLTYETVDKFYNTPTTDINGIGERKSSDRTKAKTPALDAEKLMIALYTDATGKFQELKATPAVAPTPAQPVAITASTDTTAPSINLNQASIKNNDIRVITDKKLLQLTVNFLQASDKEQANPSEIKFEVTSLGQNQIIIKGKEVSEFTQENIDNGEVFLKIDNLGDYANQKGAFQFTVSDGINKTQSQAFNLKIESSQPPSVQAPKTIPPKPAVTVIPANAEPAKPKSSVKTPIANPAPKAVTANTVKQPETSVNSIRGIERAQFGSILLENENYPRWETTNILQAALNEKIQAGEIKIKGETISTLLVKDGEFGAKTAEVAKAWLTNKNSDKTLTDLYDTEAPNDTVLITVGQTNGFMFDIGSADEINVERVQTKLNELQKELGIKELKLDGNYGSETQRAIMAFQEFYNKKTGIKDDPDKQLEVDGIAGVGTLSALGLDLS